MQSLYIQSDDAQIYCEIYGQEKGIPLVLLHGNGENLCYFKSQIEFFASQFKVIAIDSRAHGKSTRGTKPLNFYTIAEDVLAVFDALSIDKTHVLGFSDGGNIALHLALLAPERLKSMVLAGANYNPEGLRFLYRISIWITYIYLSIKALFSAKALQKKEVWGLMIHHPNLTLNQIAQIKIPTLVITGEHDMVSQKHNDKISDAIVNSKRIIVPKADHFLYCKMSDIFNQIVDEFLKIIRGSY